MSLLEGSGSPRCKDPVDLGCEYYIRFACMKHLPARIGKNCSTEPAPSLSLPLQDWEARLRGDLKDYGKGHDRFLH